ncbi:MAG: glycosyltransferase family 2 protein [Cytophagales bacterium]|nr:glycosyltransferase family 2 protein [Cytophagales bacterium]MDW8384558.1 glycosyltransferase family 2 protein [Flammeovirgaceae bacterium]
MVSVVIPVYGAPEILPELVERLSTYVPLPHEIILVDDACPQNSWKTIEALSQKNNNIVGVKHSQNQGQHHAIWTGLNLAKGTKIVITDCDLQDNPADIPKLLEHAQFHQAVIAVRTSRKDPFFKKLFSYWFWKILSWSTGLSFHPLAGNFGVYDKQLVKQICQKSWKFYFFPAMVRTCACDIVYIPVNHQQRHSGKSSYKWKKLFRLGWNVLRFY